MRDFDARALNPAYLHRRLGGDLVRRKSPRELPKMQTLLSRFESVGSVRKQGSSLRRWQQRLTIHEHHMATDTQFSDMISPAVTASAEGA